MTDLDPIDCRLLDAIQSAFPLEERPFLVLAQQLGVPEEEVLDRMRKLKAEGIIRQTSAILDSASLGYHGVLLAFRLSPDQIEPAALRINEHPGVTHNYERDHAYSLWCTLTVPPGEDIRRHAAALAALAQTDQWLFLPAIQRFKIGVNFRMEEGEEAILPHEPSTPPDTTDQPQALASECGTTAPGCALDREALRILQEDIPLVAEPFALLCENSALSPADLLTRARGYLRSGAMRRYAAILRHAQAGFVCNVMSVWRVPASQAEEAGRAMAAHPEVSHCYTRPTAPDWPYTHFAMIHAKTEDRVHEVIEAIASATGIADYCLLRTRREFKKTRMQYFTNALDEWKRKHQDLFEPDQSPSRSR